MKREIFQNPLPEGGLRMDHVLSWSSGARMMNASIGTFFVMVDAIAKMEATKNIVM